MRRRALRASALVAGLLVAACGVPTDENAAFDRSEDVPFGLLDPAAPTTTTAAAPVAQATLCLRADGHLVSVQRPVAAVPRGEALRDMLESDPTEAEQGRGLRSALFAEGLVHTVTVGGGIASVDLSPLFREGSATDQLLAIAQVVCTLTAQPGVGQVSFTVEGGSVEVPRGDGSLTASPLSRDDYAGLIQG